MASPGPDSKLSASKDKKCPFCGQAFTSSSLGRHLDLYIRDKNPKGGDGLHDVDAIRKMRGSITRRTPKKRDVSGSSVFSDSPLPAQATPPVPAIPPAVNSLPSRPAGGRVVSRQLAAKVSHEARARQGEAQEAARAAEMALRAIFGLVRAAQVGQQDEVADWCEAAQRLDFAALVIQYLRPPPTLFSNTPIASPTSWGVEPPGERERDALLAEFANRFARWRSSRSSNVANIRGQVIEAGAHAPPVPSGPDLTVDAAEAQLQQHVAVAFGAWEALPVSRRSEVWILELARGIGRKQKEIDDLKAENERLRRAAHSQNSTDLPAGVAKRVGGLARRTGLATLGVPLDDPDIDINTLVTRAIDHWRPQIGRQPVPQMPQRPLVSPAATPNGTRPVEDDGDADGDADMDMDEGFTLSVPRTRAAGSPDARFIMTGDLKMLEDMYMD